MVFFFSILALSCSIKAQIVSDKLIESSSSEPSYNVVFTSASQTVSENVGTVTVTLTAGTPVIRDLAIDYTISGTVSGTDHNLTNGTAYINVGQTTVNITFQVTDDALNESDETLTITLTPNGATHTITIQDNDPLPTILVGNGSGLEGSTIDFPVTLSAVSGRDVSFDYVIAHVTSSAGDFSGVTSGTFTIPAGTTSTTLGLETLQDGILDTGETFTLTLSAPVNASAVNSPVSGTINELVVEDIYPNFGHNWNTYTNRTSDFPCLGTSYWNDWTNFNCPHGGTQRRVKVPAYSSCGNLQLVDSLGVFKWRCAVVNSKAQFTIIGFNTGKGLKNLVTEAGYNPIKVQLTDGGPIIMESVVSNGWWSNPVIPLPNNSGGAVSVLSTPDAIYVEDTSKNTRGYNINADGITVVAGPGVTLTLESSSPNNCNLSSGEVASGNRPAMFCIGAQYFTWLEADIQLPGTNPYGVFFENSGFVAVHNSSISGSATAWGIYGGNGNEDIRLSQVKVSNIYSGIMIDGYSTILEDILVENIKATFYAALEVSFYDGLRMSRVRAFNNAFKGILVGDSLSNVLIHDVVAANNGDDGFNFEIWDDAILFNILAINNGGGGVVGDYSSINRNVYLANITSINNTLEGIKPTNDGSEPFTSFGYIFNSVSGNNGTGITVNTTFGTTKLHFENIFLGNNAVAMALDDIQNVFFNGLLNIGGNAAGCNITNSGTNTNVGITNGTCALVAPSTGTLTTTLDISSSFVGRTGTDSANTTAGAGTNSAIAYASITDQSKFQNWYRGWGKNGSAFPNSDNRGRCSAGTCNIWDLSLAPADTVLRNVNGVFTDGAPCPASVQGDNFVYYSGYGLKFATEILGDGVGNENGVCESNESCAYSPNIGAYQGDIFADYSGHSCIFQDGVTASGVKNVKMYRRPDL